MQEKEKRKRRVWRGFEAEDGTRITVTVGAQHVSIVRQDISANEDDEDQEVEMSLADFKLLLAMGGDLLAESGEGVVMRSDTGTARG